MQSREQAARERTWPQDRDTWEQQLRKLHVEAAGALNVAIVMPDDMLDVFLGAASGDGTCEMLAQAFLRMAQAVMIGGRKPLLCGSCDRALELGEFSLGLTIAHGHEHPTRSLAFGLCRHCAPDREAADGAAVVTLRRAWPDLRCGVVTHPDGGRA